MAKKIVIGVGIASHPVSAAGNTWAFLNWVLGFREAGWEVWMVEEIDPDRCIDENWKPTPYETSVNRHYWETICNEFGLADRATLLRVGQENRCELAKKFAREANLFLNISGHFKNRTLAMPQAKRIYLDLDPAFTQIWSEVYGSNMNFEGHDIFFSVGTRLGQEGVRAPTCGISWHPTFPPVVLRYWPYESQSAFAKFSTIAHWQGYPWCEWQGAWYKGKNDEFIRWVDLPRKVETSFEIATDIEAYAEELLPFCEAGWQLKNAKEISEKSIYHQNYIRSSSAEFSAAKGGYVLSQTGWFSDRSVCYLASGRPVVLQDTGISQVLPVGKGLHTFSTFAEAQRSCERVHQNFVEEQKAARQLAERYFDSQVVIARMLENLQFKG
ncbi:MAG: hypothetical protein K1X66_09735 [Verrucomicrobiae bacterium]|nr:hypothetical protein [Verrucomicrobiae bacterium]